MSGEDVRVGRPTWRQCAEAVAAILEGAKPEDMDRDVMVEVIGSNLIAREEQQKPCRTCGKPQHDFSYWRVTAAGRLLAAALRARSTLENDDG